MMMPPAVASTLGAGAGTTFTPATSGLQGLLNNPMFTTGMGLLSAGYDSRVNPFQAAMGGLSGARQAQIKDVEVQRLEALRKQVEEYLKRIEQEKQKASQGQPTQKPQPPAGMTPGFGMYGIQT